MSVNFYRRPLEENTYHPEVGGVDFTDKMLLALGELAAQGRDVFIALVDVEESEVGEGYTEQITQENCHLSLSDLDDDSDVILYRDKRDDLWFRFTRFQHPDVFDWVSETVAPWAQRSMSMIPSERNYEAVLKQMTTDVDSFEIPDGWFDEA